MMFNKILVANRSEIAIRVFRAARELHIPSVGIYSAEDRLTLHRFNTRESYRVGEGKGPIEAYLDMDDIVRIAKRSGADAIHPGYGFLSERADFAGACASAGIRFIGPDTEHLALFGDKSRARTAAVDSDVPVLRGLDDAVSLDAATEFFEGLGGGHGRGRGHRRCGEHRTAFAHGQITFGRRARRGR